VCEKKEKDKVSLQEVTILPVSLGREIMQLAMILVCSITVSVNFPLGSILQLLLLCPIGTDIIYCVFTSFTYLAKEEI
jgi:hypothetical protein